MADIEKFMTQVLGEEAAQALQRGCSKSEELQSLMGPRVILAWINEHPEFNGNIPGVPESLLSFKKSEGYLEGSIELGQYAYTFAQADDTHLAATLTVILGGAQPKPERIRTPELADLGKSVDKLVKSRILRLIKQAQDAATSAPPQKQLEPEAPEGNQRDKQTQRTVQTPKMQVTKSQSDHKCSTCGAPSFRREQFTGCYCMKSLAKYASSVPCECGYEISFHQMWTNSNIQLLKDIMGVKNDTKSK
jgi:hypothetical protein